MDSRRIWAGVFDIAVTTGGRALIEIDEAEAARAPHGKHHHAQTGHGAAPAIVGARAVLADDHAITRLGMRRALERVGVAIVAEATDAAGAIAAVRRRRPDVCLLDVALPGGGLAAAATIALQAPATRIVVLCADGAEDDVIAALHAGASGCLTKEIGPAALGRAVRATLAGEASLPRSATARIVEELRFPRGERRARTAAGTWTMLSGRESEVLELLRRELTTRQIAERLGISAVTVRRHVSHTLKRLGVPDRDAALQLVAASDAGVAGQVAQP